MSITLGERFLEILVHDLRSPLNVLKLTMHVVEEVAQEAHLDLATDLTIMRQNVLEMERMLSSLVQYAQLPESAGDLHPRPFDPSRLLRDVVDVYAETQDQPDIKLEVESPPPVVNLDPERARLAVQCALENAGAAANGHPLQVVLTGRPDRCIVEVAVNGPPKASVESVVLEADRFERLLGSAAERRGLDLATAARVSKLFGGTARLDVVSGERSVVVLEWPIEIKPASS
jgi:signal transduction histidine kinase